jgi:hypothetical protein
MRKHASRRIVLIVAFVSLNQAFQQTTAFNNHARSIATGRGRRRQCYYQPTSSDNNPRQASMLEASPLALPTLVKTTTTTILQHGVQTFLLDWKTYSFIPLVAAFVGWLTNWLAGKFAKEH